MIEVLKQALEALETEVSIDWTNNDEFNASAEKMHDAIASIRQAIAELEREKEIHDRHCNQGEWKGVCKYSDSNCPTIAELESQEPVACKECHLKDTVYDLLGDLKVANLKLSVRSQRTWVGLTDVELAEYADMEIGSYDRCLEVEAKLKEKNT